MSELYCWNHISLNKSQSGKKRIISRTLWFTFWRLAACYVSYDSSRIKGRCCYLFVNAGFSFQSILPHYVCGSTKQAQDIRVRQNLTTGKNGKRMVVGGGSLACRAPRVFII